MITDIEIKQTPDKGRGVFATKSIPKGIKHISEGIVLKSDQLDKTSPIWMYVFLAYDQSDIILVLDWTSLMNDSKNPNIMYYTNENNQVVFEVIKDINPSDELLIDYGYDVEQHTKDIGIDLSNWNNKTINKRSMKQFVFDPVTKTFSDVDFSIKDKLKDLIKFEVFFKGFYGSGGPIGSYRKTISALTSSDAIKQVKEKYGNGTLYTISGEMKAYRVGTNSKEYLDKKFEEFKSR